MCLHCFNSNMQIILHCKKKKYNDCSPFDISPFYRSVSKRFCLYRLKMQKKKITNQATSFSISHYNSP